VQVYNDSKMLIEELQKENWENTNLLMMSSGNFNGLKFEELSEMIGLI
jgi:UDP-N-acetylmuramate: L-alanyl-gamma-D-glutamyl-meso-diaminopimelate ligase